jgi:PAS domain S-box-containing protein
MHLLLDCFIGVWVGVVWAFRKRLAKKNPRLFPLHLGVALVAFVVNDLITDVATLLLGAGEPRFIFGVGVLVSALAAGIVLISGLVFVRLHVRNEELSLRVQEGDERVLIANADRERVSREAAASIDAAGSQLRRLASVVEASPDPIIGINEDGTIWQWGRAAQELLGLNSKQVLGVRADSDPDSPLAVLWREVLRLESHPSCGSQSELQLCINGAPARTVWLSLSRLPNHGDGVGGWSINLRDITEKKRIEMRISESLREKEALLKEVHHRVKNNLQLICSLIRLQSKEVSDLPSALMFRRSEERIRSLALVHEKLYRSESLSEIPFGDYLKDLAGQLVRAASIESGGARLEMDIDDINLPIDMAISLGLIASELVSHSLKHIGDSGIGADVLKVALKRTEEVLRLSISDTSTPAEVSELVTEPKTLSFKLAKSLSAQLKGDLTWDSEDGGRFVLSIPEKTVSPSSISEKRFAA